MSGDAGTSVASAPRFVLTRELWRRSGTHPHLRIVLGAALGVAVVVGTIGAIVGGPHDRSSDSAATLITRSMSALATARDVSFEATGGGTLGAGPVVYEREGSSYSFSFSDALVGTGALEVVNGVAYLRGNALYWRGSSNAAQLVGTWWRWPRVTQVATPLSGAATMTKLGFIPADFQRGAVSTLGGVRVVAVTFLNTTVYVPTSGSWAPVALKVQTSSESILVHFSYSPTKVVVPASKAAPAALRHYVTASTIRSGAYGSVGSVLSVLSTFLGPRA